MKKLFSILMMAIAMLTFSISTLAQAPTKKQRISREQLAEKQAQHIANSLASVSSDILTIAPGWGSKNV